MKITKNYNNDDLLDALTDSKLLISEAHDLLLDAKYDADDEQIKRFNRYLNLPQFERDLLVLMTKKSVAEIAELYGVTSSYIYIRLKKINKQLDGSDLD